jgi:hypothetical protein
MASIITKGLGGIGNNLIEKGYRNPGVLYLYISGTEATALAGNISLYILGIVVEDRLRLSAYLRSNIRDTINMHGTLKDSVGLAQHIYHETL